MRRSQKRQRMFADSKIPIRMTDPFHVQIFLETKWQRQIRAPNQLIKYYPVIDSRNRHLPAIAFIEESSATFPDSCDADRLNSEKSLSRGEIDSRLLFLGFDLEQNHVLGICPR